MNEKSLVLGSRGSDLALKQATFIRNILENEHGVKVDIKIIKTAGDKIDHLSFDKMEGKGFFTKELEDSLLNEGIDLAVHSLKDLMTTQPAGLTLGAVGYREDRRELLLIRKEAKNGDGLIPVKNGGTIGTSSTRRQCQIAFHNPTLKIKDLRGNVPTRVRKLREGQYDAILIAAAGVKRLDMDLNDLEVIYLEPKAFLPAPAQGILGLQIREKDQATASIISKLGSKEVTEEAKLERGLLSKFESGCSLPLGVYSFKKNEHYHLMAVLGEKKNNQWTGLKRTEISGTDMDDIIEKAYTSLTGDN